MKCLLRSLDGLERIVDEQDSQNGDILTYVKPAKIVNPGPFSVVIAVESGTRRYRYKGCMMRVYEEVPDA